MNRRTAPLLTVLVALSLMLSGCGPKSTSGSTTAGSGTSSSSSAGSGATSSSTPDSTATSAAAPCPTSNTTTFAKTKFVLHTAEGFGAFHRYLYKPLKAGTFTGGSTLSKVKAFAKAGAAALFIKRQVRLATEDVKGNPTLCNAIAAPLASLSDSISGAVTKLKSGDASGIEQANSSISSIENSAQSAGAQITENTNPNLSSSNG